MQTKSVRAPAGLRGLWLNPEPVSTAIEPLLLRMLELTHPDLMLRQAVLEELQRRAKFKDVILRALGLQEHSVDREGDCPLWVVALAKDAPHPWHDALLTPGGDCPIGFVVHTYDYGKIVLVHEVFYALTLEQQALIRRYAALTLRGRSHARILAMLKQDVAHYVFEMHNRIVAQGFFSDVERHPARQVSVEVACALEGLNDAYAIGRALGDERAEAYPRCVCTGLKYLLALQGSDRGTARERGGFGLSLSQRAQRVDITGHAASAYIKTVDNAIECRLPV